MGLIRWLITDPFREGYARGQSGAVKYKAEIEAAKANGGSFRGTQGQNRATSEEKVGIQRLPDGSIIVRGLNSVFSNESQEQERLLLKGGYICLIMSNELAIKFPDGGVRVFVKNWRTLSRVRSGKLPSMHDGDSRNAGKEGHPRYRPKKKAQKPIKFE